MIFEKRKISTKAELNKCLLVCRFLKVCWLSFLLGMFLFGASSFLPSLSSNTASIVWLASSLALLIIYFYYHFVDLTLCNDFNLDHTSLEASIWDLYKVDAISLIDEENKRFKEGG